MKSNLTEKIDSFWFSRKVQYFILVCSLILILISVVLLSRGEYELRFLLSLVIGVVSLLFSIDNLSKSGNLPLESGSK